VPMTVSIALKHGMRAPREKSAMCSSMPLPYSVLLRGWMAIMTPPVEKCHREAHGGKARAQRHDGTVR
jgi:hypothetical protein